MSRSEMEIFGLLGSNVPQLWSMLRFMTQNVMRKLSKQRLWERDKFSQKLKAIEWKEHIGEKQTKLKKEKQTKRLEKYEDWLPLFMYMGATSKGLLK